MADEKTGAEAAGEKCECCGGTGCSCSCGKKSCSCGGRSCGKGCGCLKFLVGLLLGLLIALVGFGVFEVGKIVGAVGALHRMDRGPMHMGMSMPMQEPAPPKPAK
jgi:hypothetical protein